MKVQKIVVDNKAYPLLKGLGVDVNLIQPNVNALNQLNTQKELNDIWQSLN